VREGGEREALRLFANPTIPAQPVQALDHAAHVERTSAAALQHWTLVEREERWPTRLVLPNPARSKNVLVAAAEEEAAALATTSLPRPVSSAHSEGKGVGGSA